MGAGWGHGARVNRYFADESLPDREAAALKKFARRDPRSWLSLALNGLGAALGVAVLHLATPYGVDGPLRARVAVMAGATFLAVTLLSYLWWEWYGTMRARRVVARQARVGSLLTSSFGPRALRLTTPDISYEIPYSSITRVARYGDVLVVKPRHHRVVVLPMELVTPQDLALIQSRVAGRPVAEQACP